MDIAGTEWIQPIHHTNLYEKIIRLIRDQIASGRLNPGDRLPSGRELAEKLMVSRTVVREAMRILEFMGIVKIRPGGLTVLVDIQTKDMLVDSIDMILGPNEDVIMELVEVRRLIEPPITRLAAERARAEDIQHLNKSLKAMKEEIESGDVRTQGSIDFHYSIARSTHNRVAMRIMSVLIGISDNLRAFASRTPGRPLVSLNQHTTILEAMRRKDVAAAEAAMREHFETLRDDIKLRRET